MAAGRLVGGGVYLPCPPWGRGGFGRALVLARYGHWVLWGGSHFRGMLVPAEAARQYGGRDACWGRKIGWGGLQVNPGAGRVVLAR